MRVLTDVGRVQLLHVRLRRHARRGGAHARGRRQVVPRAGAEPDGHADALGVGHWAVAERVQHLGGEGGGGGGAGAAGHWWGPAG
jgi:hypothetical protein